MEVFLDSDINKLFEILEPAKAKYIPHWESEAYGFGKYIRQYGYYPKNFPLLVFTDHSGPSFRSKFNYFEINNNAPVVMFHSPELVKKWRAEYRPNCYSLYSPYVFYRRKNKINVSPDAKGTIAYPSHSMPEMDDTSDIEEYISHLKNLPDKFQPVSVSLHYHDFKIGKHEVFLKSGMRVFTAGNPHDYRFPERFYSILRNFKYTTSNSVGTCLFYSVEMGIPFFLYGNPPAYESNTDTLLAQVAIDSVNSKDELIDKLTDMFNGVTDSISPEQKKIVETTLGLYDGISRYKMAQLLYSCYFKYRMRKIISKGKSFLSRELNLSRNK